MIKLDIQKVASIIKEVAQQEILPRYGNLNQQEIKYKLGPNDPVTVVDEKTERLLSQRLTDLLPDSLIIGEEAYSRNPSILNYLLGEDPVFVIDPLDGTIEFTKGSPAFFTIVALIKKQEIIAGFVHHPLSGETLIAEKGAGAWLNGKRLHALKPVSLKNARGTIGRKVWNGLPEIRKKLQNNFSLLACNPNSGYAAPKLLTSDSYFGLKDGSPQMHFRVCPYWSTPWDDAASLLAYAEGGGAYTNWDGKKYRLNQLYQGIIMAPDKDMIKELMHSFAVYELRDKILRQSLHSSPKKRKTSDEIN